MLIKTAVLGEVEVSPEDIINIPDGLYGFDCRGEFAVVRKQEEDVTLMWLQAVRSGVPCFVVFNPYEIIDGYEPILEHRDMNFLGCDSVDELDFLVIAVVPEDVRDITVNAKSPIAINKKDRRARQVILANRNYPIKFPLFAKDKEAEEKTEG